MTKTEAERVAAMAHALRPDWPVKSLMTILADFASTPYQDAATQLAYLATDPTTVTPARFREDGPWRKIAYAARGEEPARSNNMRCHEHPDQVMPCATCRAEMVPATASQIAGHMAAIRAATASGLATIKDERERIRARGAA